MSAPLQKLIDSTLKLAVREKLERKKNTMRYKVLTTFKNTVKSFTERKK